jgi:ArsR family transcriptional regulator
METVKVLRTLSDPVRVRLLRLVSSEDLSVAELTEIIGAQQSATSMALSQLRAAGLVEVRKQAQKSFYRAAVPPDLRTLVQEILVRAGKEISECADDDAALTLVLSRRRDHLRAYFDALAGRFGRDYIPGRSWRALSEVLIRLLPPLVIADIGCGEGTLSLMLAQRAERVVGIDNSPKMVEYAAGVAMRNGMENVAFRLGDMEALPLHDNEADIALMHQSLHHALHPDAALAEAYRVLKPGGRLLALDLNHHDFENARDLYADVWLGFSQVQLRGLMTAAGFEDVEVAVVDREDVPPYFETIIGVARKI